MAKKKEEKTNVMRILDQRKIPYTARFYEDSQGPEGTREYGVHVAEALGQDPARGFKTLVARGASKGIYVFEVPAPENLDLKKAARAVGEKSIELLHVAEINAVTGYIRGGCSPVGMKKQYPTVFHRTALDYETVYISAGKIGAQVELAPRALLDLLGASTADIVVDQGYAQVESQGEGVGGPLEVAGQKGVLKAQAGVPGEGEAVRQLIHGFGIEGVCFLQNVGGVAVEEAEIDGIHWITFKQHLMMY